MRFGVVGLGKISPAHIRAIRQVGGQVTATCDVDESRKLPEFKFYKYYDDMLGEQRFDVVSICTPNALHYKMTRDALLMNANCVVEKPFTLSSSSTCELGVLARARGMRLFPVLQNRCNPILKYVKKLLRNGDLGRVYRVEMVQHWYRPDSYFDDWHGDRLMSGGMLMTLGIHFVDMILYLAGGKPENVVAKMKKYRGLEVEDSVSCMFDIGGAMGSISFSTLASQKNFGSRLCIVAEKGTIEIGGSTAERVTVWNCSLPRLPSPTCGQNVYEGYTGSLALHPEVYRNVAGVLEKGEEQEVTVEHAKNVIAFVEEIYEACGRV